MATIPFVLRLFLLLAIVWAADAAHNVTIDDTSPLITYIPPDGWDDTLDDPLNVGGSHKVTSDSSSIATLSFLGTAVYFYSPLWPFDVTTAVSLDNAPPVTLDLRDYNAPLDDQGPETVNSSVVWSVTGLDFSQHTLLVSVAQGQNLAILDAVVYTVPDPGDTTSTTSPSATRTRSIDSTATAATAGDNGPAPMAKKGLSIALGIVCTVFGVLVLCAMFWWWRRRKRSREQRETERLQALGSPSGVNESTPSMSDAGREWELFSSPSTLPRRKQVPLVPSHAPVSTSTSHPRRPPGSHTPSTPSPLNPSATRRNKTLSTIREDSLPTSTHMSRHNTRPASLNPSLSEVGALVEDDRRTASPSPSPSSLSPSSLNHSSSVQDWQRGQHTSPSLHPRS